MAQEDNTILESKFKLLETGRKIYFEDSQHQLKGVKEAVNSLRKENKELKKTLRSIQDDNKAERDNLQGSIQDKEMQQVDAKVMSLRTKLDDQKHQNESRASKNQQLKESIHGIDLVKPG
eukprot:Rhum_TRINITY_DN19746_c0_g1::Rhum_TRINITY_DN19746_c0_g1_i1::g.170519::m.170519